MKLRADDLENFRLPRWEEFPNFELYIDQVIAFINEHLAVFNQNGETLITPSMINNYVKNGVLLPPVKKKYNRDHLAKLVVICVGKRMLSISDVSDAIFAMSRVFGVSEGYDIFCEELEYALISNCNPEKFPPRSVVSAPSREIGTIRALVSSVALLLVFDRIVGQRRRVSKIAANMFSE